jgi:hypothetical protein
MVEMEYRQKMQLLSKIVNDNIRDYMNRDSTFFTKEEDFHVTSQLICNNHEVFHKIFEKNAPIRKCVISSFFHYKNFDRAYEFLEGDYIKMSALSNYDDEEKGDDVKEYEYFLEKTCILTDKSQIDCKKNGLYVFCLTEDNSTEKFWNDYANGGKGLCLEMEIIDKMSNEYGYMYNLNDICYDDGKKLKFFFRMQSEISEELNGHLIMSGLVKFAALFKRKKYSDERETRLLIDWNEYKNDLKNIFSFECCGTKKFLKIPFNNDLFSIKIKSVTLGKNLNDYQRKKIETLLTQKEIKVIK